MDLKQLVNSLNGERPKKLYFSSTPNLSASIGYCRHNMHRGNMTHKMVKQHRCLEKQCPYFIKIDHPYWDRKEKLKILKKFKKVVSTNDADQIATYITMLMFNITELEEDEIESSLC